jgi:hypothetical protein
MQSGAVFNPSCIRAAASMQLSGRRILSGEPTFAVDWPRSIALAKHGAAAGIIAWLAQSEVRGGSVHGAAGHLTPGSLQSRGLFRQSMWTVLASGGAPEVISAGFAGAVWQSWEAWFAGYEITLQYPSLAAVEGAHAGPVANKPLLLSAGKSPQPDRLSSALLCATMERALLGLAGQAGTYEACCAVAEWLSGCFSRWHAIVPLSNIMASGPVPSYAPPQVPSGPVVGGTLSSRRPVLTDLGLFDPQV